MLDEHYLAWGASGRNGGGVRQQWSTEMNVRLMQESIELCAHFAEEMGINVWMRRGGYLFLARTKAAGARLERNVALQNRCDLPTRMIPLEEARDLVPELEIGLARVAVEPAARPASWPPATTRPTASSSPGRSSGGTRARPSGAA